VFEFSFFLEVHVFVPLFYFFGHQVQFPLVLGKLFVVAKINTVLLLLNKAQEKQNLHFLFQDLLVLKSLHLIDK